MGSNISVEVANRTECDSENVGFCSRSQSNSVLIYNPSIHHHNNVSTKLPNFTSHSTSINNSSQQSNTLDKQANLIKSEFNNRATRAWFHFKKRKNKFYKNNLELAKSNHLIECNLVEKNVNKHVQVGNGLVSLENLNFYLQSDSEYHLVNRIIKRIGLFNQRTQTDFEAFDVECLKLIEVSQNLVEQLDHLNTDHLILEECEDESSECFNMVYCGKNNRENKRNVCIQKCLTRSTVGTQTIESRAHLIIIQILRRLSAIDERLIGKVSDCDLINEFDLLYDELNAKSNVSSKHKKLSCELNDNFGGNFYESSARKDTSKHKSETITLSDSLLDDLHTIYRTKFNSQPILGEPTISDQNCELFETNQIELSSSTDQLRSMDKPKLEEYLKNLLLQVQLSQEHQKKVKSRNACVQTMNDIITDELPEYAARCPSLRKRELIYSSTLFETCDKRALEAPDFSNLSDLVTYLTKNCENDIFKVRTLFRWIANKMSFDWRYLEQQHKKMANTINRFKSNIEVVEQKNELSNVIKEEDEEAYLKEECIRNECIENECNQLQTKIDTIYMTKAGGSKEFVELFTEMCRQCEIRCKTIQGFAKNYDYRPGHKFYEDDINNLANVHHWVAVFVLANWHLIDLTWGTGYTDPIGKFQRKLNEFYFFTDPENLIYTHFPFDRFEREYERWQLLDKPISLDSFNSLPKITSNFLALNLKLRSKIENPVSFKVQTEIKISSHEPIRYKYKLFHVDELENSALNNFVFSQLKGERLVVSFVVCPPVAGLYYFKVYARAEKEMKEQNQANASLHYILTMLLDCTKARKYQNPYPLNELPYGPVQAFYNFKMQLVNQNSAIISTFGGKRKLTLQCHEPMMITYQIVDADGQEQDIRAMVNRDDENSTNLITLVILPPRVGLFKLSIFGAPRPKPNQRGKTRLPLLSTFLIDCRLAKIVPKDIDPEPLSADLIDNLGKKLH